MTYGKIRVIRPLDLFTAGRTGTARLVWGGGGWGARTEQLTELSESSVYTIQPERGYAGVKLKYRQNGGAV